MTLIIFTPTVFSSLLQQTGHFISYKSTGTQHVKEIKCVLESVNVFTFNFQTILLPGGKKGFEFVYKCCMNFLGYL